MIKHRQQAPSRPPRHHHAGTWLLAGVLGLAAGPGMAEPQFERINVDPESVGAAFVITGNAAGLPFRDEIVVSAFGEFQFGPNGPITPDAGTVSLYRNVGLFGRLDRWRKIEVVSLDEGITFPNRPTLARVNRDLRNDLILPGGYFFDTFQGYSRGSLTWWENKGLLGRRWERHDLITDSPFAYHSVAFEDFDGDHIKDIMTVGEAAGNPGDPGDDVVELQFLRGKRHGGFEAPVKVSDGGGSIITAFDVNGDGLMDVVSAQFFGPVAAQPFVPPVARDASVASYVWFENHGDGTFTRWAIGTEQGPGFAITPVPNLLGDGVTRWIATNHTNPNVTFPPFSLYPEPSVFEFTPGADPRQPWAVRTLSHPGDFPVTGGIGQAAPGSVTAGDINDDGYLDIAVAGDGSRAVYWLEQQADGSFVTREFPDSVAYGQNGGPVIEDLNRDGRNEVIFSSFDQNSVDIWAH